MVRGGMLEVGKAGGFQEQRAGLCGYYVLRALRVQTLSGLPGIQPGTNGLKRVIDGLRL